MKRKIICFGFVAIFLLASCSIIGVSANKISILNDEDDELDQECARRANTGPGTGTVIPDFFCIAQSFKPTFNILTRVKIKTAGAYWGSPQEIELVIRSSDRGLDGNNIAGITTPITPKQYTFSWIECDIPDTEVIPEETYFILWRVSSGRLSWTSNHEAPYERGKGYCYASGWTEWTEDRDYLFKTYGRNGDDCNHPPGELEVVSTTTEGKINQELIYQFLSNDIDNDQIKYKTELRSKEILDSYDRPEQFFSELFNPLDPNIVSLTIDNPAVYWMKVTAVDEHNAESPNSIEIGPIWISDYVNTPPMKPTISGEKFGRLYKKYDYTGVTWDCDKDQLYYQFSWGDQLSDWYGPFESGENCTISHRWTGFVVVYSEAKVRVKDSADEISEWSNPIDIWMEMVGRSRRFSRSTYQFPILFQLLQKLLNL